MLSVQYVLIVACKKPEFVRGKWSLPDNNNIYYKNDK